MDEARPTWKEAEEEEVVTEGRGDIPAYSTVVLKSEPFPVLRLLIPVS